MVGDVRRSGAILAPARRGLSGFLRTYAGAADPPRPNGPLMRVYDRFTLGDLIEISVIDGRQYRSRQACYAPPNKGGAIWRLMPVVRSGSTPAAPCSALARRLGSMPGSRAARRDGI